MIADGQKGAGASGDVAATGLTRRPHRSRRARSSATGSSGGSSLKKAPPQYQQAWLAASRADVDGKCGAKLCSASRCCSTTWPSPIAMFLSGH
jgi:hypothetical protein